MMDHSAPRPPSAPRPAVWLAGLRVADGEREFALGDLQEEFTALTRARGLGAARRWYWRQAFRSAFGRTPREASTRGAYMNGLWSQVKQAFRQMGRQPVVTGTAVLTFALGIGANVAIFAMAWPVLMAPLPFPDETRLMQVSLTYEREGATLQNPVSPSDYLDIRTATSFAAVAAFNRRTRQFNLTGIGDAEQVAVGYVTPEFFPLLGVRPLAGRVLQGADGEQGRVIVLNERLWRSRFSADPSVVGRTLQLDGLSYEVVGVVPASSGLGTIDAQAWVPQVIRNTGSRVRAYFLGVVARLRPGVSLEDANRELIGIMGRVAFEYPESNDGLSARARLFREETTGDLRSTLVLLLVSAGLVLTVTGVNLASLQHARDLERTRELAVRSALGASRWHLVRQALVEAMAISLAGGAVGVFVAMGVLSGLVVIAPSFGWREQLPVSQTQIMLFAGALTVVAGLLQALLPALRRSRPGHAIEALKSRGVSVGIAQVRARAGVVAGQIAVAAVLLVVASLVAASQRNVLALDPGFHSEATLVADLNVPQGTYESTAELGQFYQNLATRIEALPGVQRACVANEVPLDRTPGGMTFVPLGTERSISAWPNTITAACGDVFGLRVLAGRLVTDNESEKAIMVSASMAKALFPNGENPIGQRVHFGVPTNYLQTIVGVVADIRDGTLETSHGKQVWLPQSLGHFPPTRLLVRYENAGLMAPQALKGVVKELAPNLALARIRPLAEVVGRATGSRQLALLLLGGFALIATVLCGVGIYGTLSHSIGQRTREIGIRLALGARPSSVVRLVMWQLGAAVGVGLIAGVWAARSLSVTVTSLLYGVAATDVRLYAGVVVGLVGFALLAAWAPTRRAMRIEPRTAMDADA